MRAVLAFTLLLSLPGLVFAAAERPACTSKLDVIKFKDTSFEMVGDVIYEDADFVVMVPENGGRVKLRRGLVDEIEHDAREPKQVSTEELVDGFTHCVSRLVGGKDFRIVKVTPDAMYLNIGAAAGAHPGVELSIYREGGKIVDPETGQTLGSERDFVGVAQIIGSEEEYSKAVPVDASAGKFKVGDIGFYMRKSPVLAIAGITTEDGKESPYGSMLSEQLIGKLNQNPELKVVERTQLGKVLRELAIQNAFLSPAVPDKLPDDVQKRQLALKPSDLKADESQARIDESVAEKLHMLKGADAIIFGTVTDVDGKGAVNLRVVDTSTAAILFSTHKMVGNPEKAIEPPSEQDEQTPREQAAAGGETASEQVGGRDPEKLDLLDRILRAIYQR